MSFLRYLKYVCMLVQQWRFFFSLLKVHYLVLLCLHVADPATFRASNSVPGTLFSSENSLFIQLWKNYIFMSFYYCLINNVNT